MHNGRKATDATCSLAPAPPLKTYDIGQIAHIVENEPLDEDDDGLGGAKHRFYRSEKILGKLYRNIDESQIWAEDISRTVTQQGPSVWAQLQGLVLEQIGHLRLSTRYTRRISDAWRIRNL